MKKFMFALALSALGAAPAFAQTQQTPAELGTTTTPGIAPNGIAVTGNQKPGVYFTQPYGSIWQGAPQTRGVYTINMLTGLVSSTPAINISDPAWIPAEDSVAIVPSPAGLGFHAGDVVTMSVSLHDASKDELFINGVEWLDGFSAAVDDHNAAIFFDTTGTYGRHLFVMSDSTIYEYDGTETDISQFKHTYTLPDGFASQYVLQAGAVSPSNYVASNGTACGGCLFITTMPIKILQGAQPQPTDAGAIFTAKPGDSQLSLLTYTPGVPEPESIQFITSDALRCNVGAYAYWATGYAVNDQIYNPVSTSGAILAWTPQQMEAAGTNGHYLIQNEASAGAKYWNGTVSQGSIIMDAGLPTQKIFFNGNVGGTANPTNPLQTTGGRDYQLEGTALAECVPSLPMGCPSTKGYWKTAKHWPTLVPVSANGITWDGTNLTIGGIKYSQTAIINLIGLGGASGDALGQFLASALNSLAGAKTDPATDATIAQINSDLATYGQPIDSKKGITANMGAAYSDIMQAYGSFLNYNQTAQTGICTEGANLLK